MFLLCLSLSVGGAMGACSRYFFTQWLARLYPADFAYGTLAVNVIGSLLIGILFVLIHDKSYIPESFKPFLVTGILGSFTTFSAFSLETVSHITSGQYMLALVYVVASVVLCLLACFIGISFTRLF